MGPGAAGPHLPLPDGSQTGEFEEKLTSRGRARSAVPQPSDPPVVRPAAWGEQVVTVQAGASPALSAAHLEF